MSDKEYGRRSSLSYLFLPLALLAILLATPAHSHEINPVIVDAQLQSDNRILLTLTLNLEAQLTGIAENHSNTDDADNTEEYEKLRALAPVTLQQRAKAWQSTATDLIRLQSTKPIRLTVVGLAVPEAPNTLTPRDSVLTLITTEPVTENWSLHWDTQLGSLAYRFSTPETQDVATGFLQNGEPSQPIDMSNLVQISALDAFLAYIPVGYTHIVPLGLDHILFVIGLFLLSTHWKPLIWQISAFTLAHTITLALGMLGIIRISAAIIEPLIALSIVYVALENIVFRRMRWWRPLLIFVFGLLHGLGFASVLTDFGLSTQSFIAGLIGFNLGVEFGQLSVIAACYLLVGLWMSGKTYYRKVVVIPGSAAIAAVGAFWFLQRTLG